MSEKTETNPNQNQLDEIRSRMDAIIWEHTNDDPIPQELVQYADANYSFSKPQGIEKSRFVDMYVDRKRLLKTRVLPVGAVALVAGLAYSGITSMFEEFKEMELREAENISVQLDGHMENINRAKPLPFIREKSEDIHSYGKVCVEEVDLKCANDMSVELGILAHESQILQGLPNQYLDKYQRVRASAIGNKAVNSLINGAQDYKIAMNSSSALEIALEDLEDLEKKILQTYELRLVNHRDVRIGEERLYNGRHAGYYLLTQAFDRFGNVVPVQIHDEEDGRNSIETRWGERVPSRVFERVRDDFSDDGMVNNDLFGEKRRGYLEPHIDFYGMDGREAQIRAKWRR